MSTRTTIDLVDAGDAQRPGLKRTAAVRHPQREGRRYPGVQPKQISKQDKGTTTSDLDALSDLGLLGGPRLPQEAFPSRGVIVGSNENYTSLGGSPSSGKGEFPSDPHQIDSNYSIIKGLGLVCIPKGDLGCKVQKLISNSTGTSSSSKQGFEGLGLVNIPNGDLGCNFEKTTPNSTGTSSSSKQGLITGTLTRKVENPTTAPAASKPNSKRAIPPNQHSQQNSQTILRGSLAPNVIYKIQESPLLTTHTYLKDIGEGGFGVISLYAHKLTRALVVLKRTRQNPSPESSTISGLSPEIHISLTILGNTHPNLPKILGYNHSLTETHIWLPYYNAGDLYDL
ncbi:MAG: hypothetical protein Q9218_005198, partial [Villophora microphyllina]